MARTHYVDAYRGQRKCQFSEEGEYGVCAAPKGDHGTGRGAMPAHPFTQTPLTCQKCHEPIEIGMAYKWVAPRAHRAARGVKQNRHTSCASWKPSELTSSPMLATLYAAQEAADEAMGSLSAPEDTDDAEAYLDDLRSIGSEAAEGVREAAEMRTEASDAIVDGFGHETSQSEELRDEGEQLVTWADDIECVTFEDFDEDDVDEDALETWAQQQVETLSDELSASPL